MAAAAADREPRGLPLEGVRVLDLSNLLAGPMTTMYLADFGADVVKVEHPRGDEVRMWGLSKDGVGLFHKVINRNKRAVTLDLATVAGAEVVRRMATEVDVVVESFRPGTLERWGLAYAELRALNDRLVMARVSGYGQEGPYASRPGFGTVAEAYAGYAAISGFPDRQPLLPAFGLGDASTAIHGAYAIMLALYERDTGSGRGQCIDLALYEGLLTMLGSHVVDHDQLGVVQPRMGGRLPFASPRNTYRTGDGDWIAVAGSTQATFERTARALGAEHLPADPRFSDNRLRIANAAALDAELQAVLAGLTTEDALERLWSAGAAAGPVNDAAAIAEDPHVVARGNIVHVDDGELGRIGMQGVVPRLQGTPGRVRHAGPTKGEHNAEVYRRWAGLSEDEVAELARAGVI
jgi:crotonobetainyl-CoA:carnitine CoA-transferase CaiB-like acyl-CoA transferase